MKDAEKLDIAEFLLKGMEEFAIILQYKPQNWGDITPFTREDAVQILVQRHSGPQLRAMRDEKLRSNARGELETFKTMTVDGGYGSSFQAYSWYHADEQAKKSGYVVLDWTEGMDEKILVIRD
jgi:hypothetical protein